MAVHSRSLTRVSPLSALPLDAYLGVEIWRVNQVNRPVSAALGLIADAGPRLLVDEASTIVSPD